MLRGHKLPEKVVQDGFGMKINAKVRSALQLIHLVAAPMEGTS